MFRRRSILPVAAVTSALAAIGLVAYSRMGQAPPSASGNLPQQAYVWQRAWTPAVKESVREHAHAFDRLVVLGADVSWASGRLHVSTPEVDFALLKETHCPMGLALRIGPYSGPFAQTGQPIATLADLAAGLVDQARKNGIEPVELQIDFDCPESRLDGYALWTRAIQQAAAPTPVSVTALPSWLDRAGFKRLLTQVPQYVLQVHSLNRPSSADDFPPLCDIQAARTAVRKAGCLQRPFLVALPTYGYHVAFDGHGKYLGISAEGASPPWPVDATVRALEADAAQLSQLVAEWTRARPSAMRGVIWYRLPNGDDRLNWPWLTLVSVMAGTPPRANLQVEVTRSEAGLLDVAVVNSGSGEFRGEMATSVTSKDAEYLAADALAGFEYHLTDQKAEFRGRAAPGMLPPGGRLAVGWVRLSRDTEVKAHVATIGD